MLGNPNCHHFTQSIFIFLVAVASHCLFLCAVFLSLDSAVVVTVFHIWEVQRSVILSFCSSDCSFFFIPVGLKTYLISGQKVKEPHCSCSQALLPGLESGDGSRIQGASSAENTSDLTKTLKHVEKPKVSSCFKVKQHRSQTVQTRERCVVGETLRVC